MSSDVSDLLGGQYLSSENVQQPLLLTVSGAERIQLDGQPRLVVAFAELQKGLLCNKTNLGTLAQLFGTNTDAWTGRQVVLQTEPVQFQGQTRNGLRVKPYQQPVAPQVPVAPQQPAAPLQQPVQAAPVPPVTPHPAQPAPQQDVQAAPQPTQPPMPPDAHETQPADEIPF